MADISELEYPVLIFSKNRMLEVAMDKDALTTATSREVKIRWLEGSTIIDSNCNMAAVKSVTTISSIGPFFGMTIFMERLVRVDLHLDEIKDAISLEEIKSRVSRTLAAAIGSVAGVDEWKQLMRDVSNAPDMKSIMALLQPHYDRMNYYKRLRCM